MGMTGLPPGEFSLIVEEFGLLEMMDAGYDIEHCVWLALQKIYTENGVDTATPP
jgi:hypothetical protein